MTGLDPGSVAGLLAVRSKTFVVTVWLRKACMKIVQCMHAQLRIQLVALAEA